MSGCREVSVFLTHWFSDFPAVTLSKEECQQWHLLLQVRHEVNKALETARSEERIRSALVAEVLVYADEKIYSMIEKLGEELRFILITSEARVFPMKEKSRAAFETNLLGLALEIKVAQSKKCARCWQRRSYVGYIKEYADLCERCVSNVFGDGEIRHFA